MDQVNPFLPDHSSGASHLRAIQCQAPSAMTAAGTQDGYAAPGIDQVIREFLENTKARFGESSREVHAINKALFEFSSARISKRDALTRIFLELRGQTDLRQDLMDVLYHKDARWGVGDFDLEQAPVQAIPQFLQPAHQPQLRLPSMSTSWATEPRPFQTINPAMLGGHYGTQMQMGQEHRQDSLNTQPSSRMWSLQSQSPSSPISQGSFYSPFSGNLTLPAPDFENRAFHNDQPLADPMDELSPGSPPFLGVPMALRPAQTTIDKPSPLKKCDRRAPSIEARLDQQPQEVRILNSVETPGTTGVAKASPKDGIDVKLPMPLREESGRFVHSLCGKAFSTRYKVKKHHWGLKCDDLETTTGCWAKHQKPEVSWNAHPSCEEQPAPKNTSKGPVRKAVKDEKKERPLLPALSSYGVIPGFPTLEDLPQAVAEAVSPHVANQSISEDSGDDPDEGQQSVDVQLRMTQG